MARKFLTKAMAWSTIAYMIIGLLVILFGAIFLSQQFGQSSDNANNILDVNKYTTTTKQSQPFFKHEVSIILCENILTHLPAQALGGNV